MMEGGKQIRLDTDIWYMVFALIIPSQRQFLHPDRRLLQLHETWLRATRLVSTEFNTVVTPYAYEWMNISEDGLLERLMDGSGEQCSMFLENIRRYTQWLEVTGKPIEHFYRFTASLIGECRLLKRIQWQHAYDRQYIHVPVVELSRMASSYFDAYMHGQSNPPSVRFEKSPQSSSIMALDPYVRLLMMSERDLNPKKSFSRCNPGKQAALSKYRTNYDTVYEDGSVPRVERRVLAVIELCTMDKPSTRIVPGGRKFPPMLKLKLDSHKWGNLKEECSIMWDFSRIRTLSFTNSGFFGFLEQTPINAFKGLRTLKISYHDPTTIHDLSAETSGHRTPQIWLECLLERCPELESLKIDLSGWDQLISFDNAARLGGTKLRKLRLRSTGRPCSIPLMVLRDGLEQCAGVVDLELDLNVSIELSEYLTILAGAKNLQDLTLRAQYSLRTDEVDEASTDKDYDGATNIMKTLHSQKSGKPFNKIQITLTRAKKPPNWRQKNAFDSRSMVRMFMSRVNGVGSYEQWGDERVEKAPKLKPIVYPFDRSSLENGDNPSVGSIPLGLVINPASDFEDDESDENDN